MAVDSANLRHEFMNQFNRTVNLLKEKSLEYPHITKSVLLHFGLIILMAGFVPHCSKDIEKPKVIAIDILPMGEAPKTLPQAQPKKEPAKPQEKKPEPPKPAPKVEKKPETATKMEKAEKPKAVPKPAAKKPAPTKVEKKPEEVKKPQDQQKKDTQDQEGKKKLLKDLEKKEQAELDNIFEQADKEPAKPTSQVAQNSGKSDVVSPALVNQIMGIIQGKVQQNWNIPIGVKDVQNMKVPLYIKLDRAGNVIDVKIVDQLKYNTDTAYRVLSDSAVWAVKEASPFSELPKNEFDTWQELELSFDPSDVL